MRNNSITSNKFLRKKQKELEIEKDTLNIVHIVRR